MRATNQLSFWYRRVARNGPFINETIDTLPTMFAQPHRRRLGR